MSEAIKFLLNLGSTRSDVLNSIWKKAVITCFAIVLLLTSYITGGWVLYMYLVEHVRPVYALFILFVISLTLSVVCFFVGVKLKAKTSPQNSLTPLLSNILIETPDGEILRKLIKAIPPKALAVLILSGGLLVYLAENHKKHKN